MELIMNRFTDRPTPVIVGTSFMPAPTSLWFLSNYRHVMNTQEQGGFWACSS